jgi:large subunit ribosomal protein L5
MADDEKYTPRLRAAYDNSIRPALKEEFGYKSDMQIPRLDKIVLNIGAGKASVKDSKKSQISAARFDHNRWSTCSGDACEKINCGLSGS